MVGANYQQTRQFPLRAGVGLKRDSGKTGHLRQPVFQLLEERLVPACLAQWRKRMDAVEFRPGNRNHLHGCIQLHRARSERDHRTCQREVAIFQTFKVTKHFRFRMVAVENRMGQVLAGTGKRRRIRAVDLSDEISQREVWLTIIADDTEDLSHVLLGGRFIEGNTDGVLVDRAEVHPA